MVSSTFLAKKAEFFIPIDQPIRKEIDFIFNIGQSGRRIFE